MKLSFVGYADKHHARHQNPDGSEILMGQAVYVSPFGVFADAYYLIELLEINGGLGDSPEIPEDKEWRFKKPGQ